MQSSSHGHATKTSGAGDTHPSGWPQEHGGGPAITRFFRSWALIPRPFHRVLAFGSGDHQKDTAALLLEPVGKRFARAVLEVQDKCGTVGSPCAAPARPAPRSHAARRRADRS